MVNEITPFPVVPAGPSHYLIRDRPILTRCLPSDWADQVEEENGPGLPEDSSEAPQGTGDHSLSQAQAPEAMDVIERISTISEASSQPQDFAWEAWHKASPQASLARFSEHTSNP